MIPTNKGMMDDLFDFLFTVFIAVIALWFIYTLLVQGVAASQDRSVQLVLDLHEQQNELVVQRNMLQQGQEINLIKLNRYGFKDAPQEEVITT